MRGERTVSETKFLLSTDHPIQHHYKVHNQYILSENATLRYIKIANTAKKNMLQLESVN
jgi:hypothetical protein